MKCPQCQFDNRGGVKFCEKCGVRMELICPACGAKIPPDRQFCGECGLALSQGPDSMKPESPAAQPPSSAERKTVTVLFSDLSGYTAMAEKLDPEEVKEITSQIFGEVAKIVSRYDGFVEKYIGDAVVALFGVPKAHEDDHLRAIRAAKEIHEIVNTVGLPSEEKIGRRLTFHSGIATGLVVTGEVNLEKGTHGVGGDTINLASRLSGLAKLGEILVGESTYLQGKGAFSFDRLDPVTVKGKAEPVIPYLLLEEKNEPAKGFGAQGISSPLVGRNAEVAAIRGCFNRLLDGQGGILFIIGEAGLGKSRLMAEIRNHYTRRNLLWLEGHTLSYGQKMSYWPFREILWQYTGITEDDSDREAWDKFEAKIIDRFPTDSGEILPYLASLIGLEVKGDLGKNLAQLDGESVGKQIYLSSRRFLERLAQTPLALVFEDLHWADESTVALIEHLYPLITRVSLLICGVSRPEGAPAARLRETALKDHERRYTEIRLSPLSSTESMDLMNNLLSIENLPSRTRQLILERADGNPFFLEEIMRTLIDRGAVRPENSRWKVTSRIETIAIPDTIQGVIMARVDRLDEEVKQILKTASVIGRAFLYRLLKEVTDAVKELDRHLDTLTSTELIREKQKIPELEYIFKHALVQESTYESILLKKRHELHGKVASAIETLFSDRLDEFSSVLAYHYAKAEHWEKAQEYLFKAGDQAGKIAADAEALTHYQQALETYTKVFGDRWDPVERGILERKMGEAFYRRGENEKAIEYLERALVYFGRPRLPSSPGKVRLGTLREIGVQLGHRLFPKWIVKKGEAPVGPAVEEVARIYQMVMVWDIALAPEHFLLTTLVYLNYSERVKHIPGIVSGFSALAAVAYLFSFYRLSRFLLRRSVVLSEKIRDPSALLGLYMQRTAYLDNGGQLDEAIEGGLKGAEIVRATGYRHLSMWGQLQFVLFLAHWHKGDMRSCLSIAQDVLRAGQDADEPFVLGIGLWCLGCCQEWKGDFQGCTASVTRAIELFEAMQNHFGQVLEGGTLGRCYCRMGELEKSLAVLTKADEHRVTHRVRLYEYYVSMALLTTHLAIAERGEGRTREEHLREARPIRKRVSALTKGYPVSLPEALRLQGVYDWLTGKQASAQKHWQRSLVLAEEMGMRYELAMTRLEMGTRLNDREHLQQAEAIFAGIGAEFDLAQTRELLEKF